jgi:citrate lyase subunit beta-like protein
MLYKSRALNVDLAVYDLEDSVKLEARNAVTDLLRKPRATNIREQAVRINAVDSGYALQDLTEVVSTFSDKLNTSEYLH